MSANKISATLMFGSIAKSSQTFADFLSDSKATLGMIDFYFNKENRDSTAAPSKTEEWLRGPCWTSSRAIPMVPLVLVSMPRGCWVLPWTQARDVTSAAL